MSDEQQYQQVFDALEEGLLLLDVAGAKDIRVLMVNPGFERMARVQAADLIGRRIERLDESSIAARIAGIAVRCIAEQRTLDEDLEDEAGVSALRASLIPLLNGNRVVRVLGVVRDTSAFKRMESELQARAQEFRTLAEMSHEREQRFRTLAENTPDTIARFDRDARYLYVNPAVEELMGLPPQTYIGTRAGEVTRRHGLLRDGESPDVFRDAVVRTFEQGVRQDIELQVSSRTGQRILAFRIVPERNSDGVITSVLSISRDVTDIRIAETALKQINATLEARVAVRTEELQEANRELEKFAYTVSHDLRAPLRAIDGFVHLLMENERSRLSDEGRKMLDRISSAGIRLGKLIDDILEYSRIGQFKPALQTVNMTALAKEVVASLKPEYPRSSISIAPLPDVEGDPTMLRQVLQNLIGNALKFSARSSEPRIEIGAREQDGKTVYYVADNGIGFDTRHADKLFGVFERLHARLDYPGTGVGLAIVKRLIERQGGDVWAESTPDVGSTFYFTLT